MPYVSRIKICCISSLAEAQLAISYGVDALGLVSQMPSGPGVICESLISEIARRLPPGVSSFLLTSKQDVGEIIAQQRRCRTSVIQIVDSITSGNYGMFRRELPGIAIVQVVHVAGSASIDEACVVASQVDAILLDSGNQALDVKELGGTGRTHDWSISRAIREAVDKPLYLAGGLGPANVAQAIREVRPFGVDVCSGVRTDGKLDETKLAAFVRAVRGP